MDTFERFKDKDWDKKKMELIMDVVFHRSLLPRGSPESTDSSEGGV